MSPRLFLLLVVAAAVACRRKDKHAESHEPSLVAPFRAALNAPEGKTPCESAHNSLIALEEAAIAANMPAPWPVLPKREEFLDVCQRLPLETQRCLFPRYHSQHHDKCVDRIAEMETDEWGKIIRKMINADGVATKPAGGSAPLKPGGASTPVGQSTPSSSH